MPELVSGLWPCTTGTCPTHVQGGTEGMLSHLHLIHHPDLTLEQIEEKYSEQLWPEISGRAGE